MWSLRDQTVYDLQMFKKKSKPDDPTEMLYTIMHRAENGQCVIDNSRTCTTIQINGKARYPEMSIGIDLAKKMKWIKMGKLQNTCTKIPVPNLERNTSPVVKEPTSS